MITVTSELDRPIDVPLAGGTGKARLPARGSITADVHPAWVAAAMAAPIGVRIDTVEATVPPATASVDELRALAESLGISVQRRWGAARLQIEIDAALSGG